MNAAASRGIQGASIRNAKLQFVKQHHNLLLSSQVWQRIIQCGQQNCKLMSRNTIDKSQIRCVGRQCGQCTCEPMRLRAPATMWAPAGSLATTSITCSGIVSPSWWKNSRVRYGEPHLRSAARSRRPDISQRIMRRYSSAEPMNSKCILANISNAKLIKPMYSLLIARGLERISANLYIWPECLRFVLQILDEQRATVCLMT